MFCANICGPLDEGMAMLLKVFTQKNFVADYWNSIILKNKKSLLEPPFERLRGNVYTPCIARWKTRGQLLDFLLYPTLFTKKEVAIHHNWTFFAISYGWDVTSRNLSKSACSEGDGSLWAQISDGMGRRPPTTVGVRKLEWLPFRVVSKYLQCIVWFSHKARMWQTDR